MCRPFYNIQSNFLESNLTLDKAGQESALIRFLLFPLFPFPAIYGILMHDFNKLPFTMYTEKASLL